MPAPSKKAPKAVLLKLFILDAHGGYAGEYAVDAECVVEYGDVLKAIPESGLRDQQTVYLGENMATAFHGEKMSLVAITRGPIGPEDLAWVSATLTVTEAHLLEATETGAPGPGPDKAVLESLSSALEKREAQLADRERALAEAEGRAKRAADEARAAVEAELASLREQLAQAQARLEQEKNRAEVERVVRVAVPASPGPGTDEERRQLDKDRKMVQRRALDLLDREEKLRAREMEVASDAEYLVRIEKEKEALRGELEAAKKANPPGFDPEAARREIDQRVKILQQKALDLLAREERLRKEREELERRAAEE